MIYDDGKLTDEELYEIAVDDIFNNKNPDYNTILLLTNRFLVKYVKKLCDGSFYLKGGEHNEDILVISQIKIVQFCERSFFEKAPNGQIQPCEQFKAWCYTVAKNSFISYLDEIKKKLTSNYKHDKNGEDKEVISDALPKEGVENLIETEMIYREVNQCKIKECFEIVFDLDSNPHIILTWLSVFLYMYINGANRIESTRFVADFFSALTMKDMFRTVSINERIVEWLDVSPELLAQQRKKLDRVHPETGKKIGDMKYSDFYMIKGPEKSISDWVNRINDQVKLKFDKRGY